MNAKFKKFFFQFLFTPKVKEIMTPYPFKPILASYSLA
jgi:hypothetical protein